MAGKSAPTQTEAAGAALVAKLVAATPFALATLAILYDAGYFNRIGVDFFPLFSLTEHLMFGMEGIPYLLVTLALLYFAVAISVALTRRSDPAERARVERQFNGVLAISFALGGVGSLFLYPGAWPNAALCFVGALMLGLWSLVEGSLRVVVIIAGNFVIWMLAAFAAGYWIGAGVLNPRDAPVWQWLSAVPKTTISLTDGPPLSGRVLRSGERGLLVFNTLDGSIQFKRWQDVRGIDLSPAGAR